MARACERNRKTERQRRGDRHDDKSCNRINAARMTMMETSYAAAAAAPAPHMNGMHKRSLASDLFTPPPESFTLVAALLLLEPLGTKVYLMPRKYLENWVRWAYQQPTQHHEADRVRKALKLVAEANLLDLSNPEFTDPGPIDCREMSIPGHPLLLRPEVEVGEPQSVLHQRPLRRVLSFNNALANGQGNHSPEDGENGGRVQCCVVQERFYEVRTHCLLKL